MGVHLSNRHQSGNPSRPALAKVAEAIVPAPHRPKHAVKYCPAFSCRERRLIRKAGLSAPQTLGWKQFMAQSQK